MHLVLLFEILILQPLKPKLKMDLNAWNLKCFKLCSFVVLTGSFPKIIIVENQYKY